VTVALLALALVTPTVGASAYEAIAVDAGGEIVGVVRATKAPPAPPPLPVFKNSDVCGATVTDDSLVIGPGGTLRYAIVTLEDIARGQAPEAEAVTVIDNVDCRFVPHVATASVGQWLLFRNSDPILHNADGRLGKRTLFNVALPTGREVRRPLVEPGLVEITCDVRHTWMKAYVFVASHPYHAVTDAAGAYVIGSVPAGTYNARVWHERLGEQRQEVHVEPSKTTTLDFDLRP
jgi:plastocyanin